jgi:hypothetical protein
MIKTGGPVPHQVASHAHTARVQQQDGGNAPTEQETTHNNLIRCFAGCEITGSSLLE